MKFTEWFQRKASAATRALTLFLPLQPGFGLKADYTSLASISGKILGTNNDDYLGLRFIWQETQGPTGQIDIARVQVEVGDVATDFERRPLMQETALCYRYARGAHSDLVGEAETTSLVYFGVNFGLPMRAVPTVTLVDTTPSIGEFGVGGRTGSGSTVWAADVNNLGGVIGIDGFTGLTAGNMCVGSNSGANILFFDAEL